jgi:cytochrome d ubiquinol oxidase subunit II
MTIDLVMVWAALLAFSIFMYVLMDGFDLGVGILFPFAPDDRARDLIINSVTPVWDGNETWLVLVSFGLLAVFPFAFAVILPALYFPILVMLMALIFRGVAFEFRLRASTNRRFWNQAFFFGSLLATIAQGVILGAFLLGFKVVERHYAGGSFDWLRPFSIITGIGLIFGYGLLGSTWLILKTEGALQEWARDKAQMFMIGVIAFIVIICLYTPTIEANIARRWFSWPASLQLAPVPITTAVLAYGLWRALKLRYELAPFVVAMGLFLMCYLGLVISIWPNIIPHRISFWEAASSHGAQAFLLIGTVILLPIILSYTAWSYWVFRGKARADIGGYD